VVLHDAGRTGVIIPLFSQYYLYIRRDMMPPASWNAHHLPLAGAALLNLAFFSN
jgi:hypothetical protein